MKKIRSFTFSLLLIVANMLGTTNAYSQQVQGPYYSVQIGFTTLQCLSHNGFLVPIYFDYGLADVGYAWAKFDGSNVIVINPNVVQSFSLTVQRFWFLHECAHVALPTSNESLADCWAIKQMGFPDRSYLDTFEDELSNLGGSRKGHLPGPQRVKLIKDCAII